MSTTATNGTINNATTNGNNTNITDSKSSSKSSVGGGSAATSNKVTSATYGALDTSDVTDEVWMIRIPNKLSKLWNNLPEGTILGELEFTKGGKVLVQPQPQQQKSNNNTNGNKTTATTATKPITTKQKPSITIKVNENTLSVNDNNNNNNNDDIPLNYTFEAMTNRVPTLHPFVRNENGSITLQGKVSRTANLQMSIKDERYRQLSKNRLIQTNVKKDRYVKPIDTSDVNKKSQLSASTKALSKTGGGSTVGFGNAVQQTGKKILEQNENLTMSNASAFDMGGGAGGSSSDGAAGGMNSRKRKFEEQTTKSVIFELFSTKKYWSVKELRYHSGKAEKEIRSVLQEVGEFHRSGEYKSMWSLRNEFAMMATTSNSGGGGGTATNASSNSQQDGSSNSNTGTNQK